MAGPGEKMTHVVENVANMCKSLNLIPGTICPTPLGIALVAPKNFQDKNCWGYLNIIGNALAIYININLYYI